jgi:signal transduction histidine kinase
MTASPPPAPPRPASSSAERPAPARRRAGVRSWLRIAVGWRNWRLPVKVAAVLVVPAVAAVSLGAVQIDRDVSSANSFGHIQQLVALRNALTPLATDLQTERWLTAQKLGTTTKVSMTSFAALTGKVDGDAQTVTGLGAPLLDSTSAAGVRYQSLANQLGGLAALHKQAQATDIDAITAITDYTTLLGAVFDLDQALSTQLGDPTLTEPATAMTDIEVAQEQVRQQQAIVAVIVARSTTPAIELSTLNAELATLSASDTQLQQRLQDFQVVAAPDELERFTAISSDVNNREGDAQTVMSNSQILIESGGTDQNAAPLGGPAASWITDSDTVGTGLAGITRSLANELGTRSSALHGDAVKGAGIQAAILLGILLLAMSVGVIVGRHLLRSLGILRRTALDVAEHRLPEMVANIDAGDLTAAEVEPVPLHTHEELGQLARAFDAVYGQAVTSAVGQASLRANLRNIFVNLSRRSQSLVERQLRLMEKLERNEEDPQQLANLFRLDHLATRMRRNNENLMVLSGDDPARRSGHPLPLADVLRAAVSEIEQYQRVVVRSTPSVDVLGYASGDLVRLVAELLDNATSFSPPGTQVRIGGETLQDGSVRIEIHDEGIGMAGGELVEVNRRLATPDTEDVPVSRQMGLYVVGRLARRHSIVVGLEGAAEGGLLAVVMVPADLLKPGSGPVRPTNGAVPGGSLNGHAPANGTNGHASTNGLLTAFGPGQPGQAGTSRPDLPAVARPTGAAEPEWGSFAGAVIGEPTGGTDFTWFAMNGVADEPQRPPTTIPPAPVAPPGQAADYTQVGLPRRVPRANAVPSLMPPSGPPASRRGTGRTAAAREPAHSQSQPAPRRNPVRAKGFLDDYQAGIRQGRPDPAAERGPGEAK